MGGASIVSFQLPVSGVQHSSSVTSYIQHWQPGEHWQPEESLETGHQEELAPGHCQLETGNW
jgi:hypothetical protein